LGEKIRRIQRNNGIFYLENAQNEIGSERGPAERKKTEWFAKEKYKQKRKMKMRSGKLEATQEGWQEWK